MVSRPLYLFSQFFEDKAIEKLLGAGINPCNINITGIDIKYNFSNEIIDSPYGK